MSELQKLVSAFFFTFSVTTEEMEVHCASLLRDNSILILGVTGCVCGHGCAGHTVTVLATK